MRFCQLKKSVLVLVAVFALSIDSTQAMSVMEFGLDNLLLNSTQIKTSLNLTKNQDLLWQQTEVKLRSIAHQRGVRREHMQFEISKSLKQPRLELRDLNKQIEDEEAISSQENKQIRELCLTLNDALDDNQREKIQNFLSEQLLMQADSKRDAPDGVQRRPASGGHSRGGSVGAGGSMGGGANGGNVQF